MGTRFNEDRKGRIAIRKNKLQISKKYKYYFSLFVSIIFLQRASPGEMAEELKKNSTNFPISNRYQNLGIGIEA